jgi:tetrahydromethanopterin S-methyltransferase subunit B
MEMDEPIISGNDAIDAKKIHDLIEAEVAPLKEKIAKLEKQIDLQPLTDKIKELDKKRQDIG